jgi:hypothetical protein
VDWKTTPRAVACATCGAAEKQECRGPTTHVMKEPHAARVEALQAQQAKAAPKGKLAGPATKCVDCGVEGGSTIIKTVGKGPKDGKQRCADCYRKKYPEPARKVKGGKSPEELEENPPELDEVAGEDDVEGGDDA